MARDKNFDICGNCEDFQPGGIHKDNSTGKEYVIGECRGDRPKILPMPVPVNILDPSKGFTTRANGVWPPVLAIHWCHWFNGNAEWHAHHAVVKAEKDLEAEPDDPDRKAALAQAKIAQQKVQELAKLEAPAQGNG